MNNVAKCHIKKGDTVVVIAGSAKGSTGKVLQILPQTGRALVEGVNFMKKHMRKSQDNPQGGISEMEAPIAISNLKVSG
ncbi:MAG: 50S ribosomal protein L24 [Kiritimatiellaceae bacterium]|nr:50S ribosomal protein L24 [Kiritimatiellaceae bacterium]